MIDSVVEALSAMNAPAPVSGKITLISTGAWDTAAVPGAVPAAAITATASIQEMSVLLNTFVLLFLFVTPYPHAGTSRYHTRAILAVSYTHLRAHETGRNLV